ncbi:MAG: TraM recognition domain-containing protein [Gammaproteobacteria bacterium]|nr:TraM recognition domain-containing protein [Gammaproteobacteria bacterium]
MNDNVVDLDFPLVQLSEKDRWTVRDAFEGTMVLGGTGSGKTSGSGHTFANAFLQAGFGGLVLTAKPDELAEWRNWASACGREDQLLVVHPAEPWYFDFMEYEARRDNGSDTQTMVSLFMLIIEIANEGSIQSQETYWLLALRQMLRNAIDMLKCAGELITVETLYRLIVSAPTSVSRLGSEDWQQDSYCFRCLNTATDQYEALTDLSDGTQKPMHFDDFDIAFLYWTNEFPNLAEKTRSIIVSMFTTTADAFLRGTLKRLFVTDHNKRPAPPELARQGAIIVMDLNIKEHEDVGRIAQGVYKLMFQKANERQVASDSTPGVFLYADECQFFLNSYDLAFQQTARSSRIASFYLSQTLSNFHVGLGERGEQKANALLGNLSTKIFHANPDTTTNEWSAKLIGEDWSLQSSSTSSFDQQDEARMSTNLSEQRRYIIEPIAFTQLQRGGQPYDYTVSALMHQVGRTWSTGNNYLEVFFQQSQSQ